ncbi:MAG: carboxypeptidase [Chthonomonas sp.]|nr:carboxypeptidase [Chthonomonas sp.]
MEIAFNRYYRFDELTQLLRGFAAEYPALIELTSIGNSFEGRDIWLVTVTNSATGAADSKPAFWCDGNIHASEVSASTAVLYLINKLVTGFGKDETITRALDSRAFYLVPRLGPDGAEWALADKPKIVRSSTRPYPYNEEDPYGLEREDVDGDGRVLNMRVPDPNGAWVIDETEPRLLRRRKPGEVGKQFYRVMPEGLFQNFDGITMRGRKIQQGLDMNRNFPSAWRTESEQYGAGPFPTSEPEIRAAVQAICDRPNICGAVTFHTFSGVHLRPPSRFADDDMPAEDLWIYKEFGKVGEEMTGYPAISNYHEFKYHPKEVITGVFDDWALEHRGIIAWTTELWSPQRQAGITDYKYIDWFRDHPFEDDIKMLKWSDEKLDGNGYIDWYAFEHPQLGQIELGGWDPHYAFRNPPPKYLEAEVAPHADWVIWQALASPKLEWRDTLVDDLGGSWRIRAAFMNTGYLPSFVTETGRKKKVTRGVVGEISKPGRTDLGWLASGDVRKVGPELTGWSHVTAGGFGWQMNATDDMVVFEWVVSEPGEYRVVAQHDKAGRVEISVSC